MRQIQPTIWTNNGLTATQLIVTCAGDDYATARTYAWTLLTAEGAAVDAGAIEESGATYTPVIPSVDYAYNYVAANLSQPLTLIVS